jgi:hypothetical protein
MRRTSRYSGDARTTLRTHYLIDTVGGHPQSGECMTALSLDRHGWCRPAPPELTVTLKGLGKLATPIASRDIKKRWETSLERLKAAAETGQ